MPIRPQKCIKHPKFLTSRMLKLTGQSKCEKNDFLRIWDNLLTCTGEWKITSVSGRLARYLEQGDTARKAIHIFFVRVRK